LSDAFVSPTTHYKNLSHLQNYYGEKKRENETLNKINTCYLLKYEISLYDNILIIV